MNNDDEKHQLIDEMRYDDEEIENATNKTRSKSINFDYDQKEINNYEEALSKIGFGRFQYLLVIVCSIAQASDAVEILCVSFILPAAECDLNLSSRDKGFLGACLFLGAMFGGYIWGGISDLYGRKPIMILSLAFNAVFSMLCGLSQDYITLAVFRFLSGFGVGGSIPILWSYFIEFMPKHIRGSMMCLLSSAWIYGNLLVIFIAYNLLQDQSIRFTFFSDKIVINNWRLFMILCGIPSAMFTVLITFFPESPKFYLYNFNYEGTQEVLKYVYLFNNKIVTEDDMDRKRKTFKFFEKLKHRPIITSNDFVRSRDSQMPRTYLAKVLFNAKNLFKQTVLLFKSPYTLNTIIILIVNFALLFGYYGIWMWLPELFERMKRYGGTPCRPSEFTNSSIIESRTCIIDKSVFPSSVMSALSNVPASIITIIYIDKIGRNTITFLSFITSALAVLGIAFVNTQTQGVILITIFGCLNTITFNSFGCTCTELYPTTIRSTAFGLQSLAGRIGAIFGSLLFGLAVDIQCYIPLGAICFIMIISGFLSLILPESKNIDIH